MKNQIRPLHSSRKINLFKTFYVFTIFTLVVSVVFRVYCSNILAEKNSELRTLYTRKVEIEKELTRLSYIDAELSSLQAIELRAKELGFVEFVGTLLSVNPESPASVAALTGR